MRNRRGRQTWPMRAVQVLTPGDPHVMTVVDLPTPVPAAGQTLVTVSAAGVNYLDTYHRSGLYPKPLPFIVGTEGCGQTQDGQRVAWATGPGSYAEYNVVDSAILVPVPDDISDETAAAIMLQGMTVHYLLHSAATLVPGDAVLITAGAGGVGLLFLQWAKSKGINTITTVSSETKEQLARAAGATHVIRYDKDDVTKAVRDLTNGVGVVAAYDGVGAATFESTIACVRPRGTMVLFGSASGPVPAFDLQRLNGMGSIFLTRPNLSNYLATRDELLWRANDVFEAVRTGVINVSIHKRYSLDEAVQAHIDLQSRQTTGKLLIIP